VFEDVMSVFFKKGEVIADCAILHGRSCIIFMPVRNTVINAFILKNNSIIA